MTTEARLRGIAEVEAVHRDAQGNIVSVERATMPVSFVRDENGKPQDIRPEEA